MPYLETIPDRKNELHISDIGLCLFLRVSRYRQNFGPNFRKLLLEPFQTSEVAFAYRAMPTTVYDNKLPTPLSTNTDYSTTNTGKVKSGITDPAPIFSAILSPLKYIGN